MSVYAPEAPAIPLDPYIAQTGAAATGTESLITKVAALALGLGGVRAVAGGAAADFQHMASGMAASSRVTSQSFNQLSAGSRQLQRDFPLASAAAYETVRAVQSLGLTAKNQVGQVGALSNVMTKLAGATGSGAPAALAQSFGQLNREMANLDPARVQRFGDSLTTLSARSGTSAQGIVSFAQSISPFAQAAGVGETALLGISTAFSKLGNDGYVAANTVNTMFSDLTRSVRDGGNQMAAYATILGVTTGRFKEMYQHNPADVIAQVTEKIGTSGSAGSRMLESIGIEGIRGQRALLLASQSGGLRSEIAQAEASYGSGATQNAQQAAYGNLTDSLTRLGNASTQVAEAFERPLLHAATQFANVAGGVARTAGGFLSSGPVSTALSVAGQAAAPLAIAHLVGRGVSTGALGSFLLRSGPVTGLLAGIRAGRQGGIQQGLESVPRTQPVANMLEAALAGVPLGRPGMAATNQRALEAGSYIGSLFPPGGGDMGLLRRASGYGVAGAGLLMRSQSEMLRLARLDPMEREARVRGFTAPHQIAAGRFFDLGQQLRAGTMSHPEYLKGLAKEVDNLAKSSTGARAAIKELGAGLGSILGQGTLTGLAGARAGGMGVLRGIGGFLGTPGGMATAGVGLALGGYEMYSHAKETRDAENERLRNLDFADTLNRYRDEMGQAGIATHTLADAMKAAADRINQVGASTRHRATTVSDQDLAAAGPVLKWNDPKIQQAFRGQMGAGGRLTTTGIAQIAGQVSAIGAGHGGLGPQDLQAAKLDLLRQGYNRADVQTILGQAGTSGRLTDQVFAGIAGGVATGARSYSMSSYERSVRGPAWQNWSDIGRGHFGEKPLVGAQGKQLLDTLQGAVGDQYTTDVTKYGQGYAVGQEIRAANRAVQAALKTRNADTVAATAKRMALLLSGGKETDYSVSASQLENTGGNLAQQMANSGVRIQGHDLAYWQSRARMQQRTQQTAEYTMLQQSGATALMPFFDALHPAMGVRAQRASGLAQRAIDQPENLSLQTRAVSAMVNSATSAGTSLSELAHQATKAGGTFAEGSQQQIMMAKVLSETQFRMATQLQGATRSQTWQQTLAFARGQANTNGNSQWAQQQREQGRQTEQQVRGEMIGYYQQRLMAQRQYQISAQRTTEDYQLQVSRSEEDFHINRLRAEEDFNIQLKREREDAAKSLYDPYTRIQVQPVWSANLLIGNEQTQIQAMRQQLKNIATLKDLGMTEATIQMLGLYSPDHAMEAAELIRDLQGHHGEVRTLNQQTATRTQLAGKLISQDPQYQRQREDFNRSLRRQNEDFARQTDRAHADFLRGQRRMAQDVHMQDLELTNDLGDLQKGMNAILNGQMVDFSNIVEKTMRHTLHTVDHWAPKIKHGLNSVTSGKGGATAGTVDVGIVATGGQRGGGYGASPVGGAPGSDVVLPSGKHITDPGSGPQSYVNPGTGKIYHGSTTDDELPTLAFRNKRRADPHFNMSIAKSMKPDWARKYWSDWYNLWQGESGWSQYAYNPDDPMHYGQGAYGIPQSYPGHKMRSAGADWQTNPATQIKWGIDYIARTYGDPHKAWLFKQKNPKGYADGGIAMSPHLGMVAEAGNAEAMIPLNQAGVAFMAQIFTQYLSSHDAATLGSGGGRGFALHIDNSQHYYDQGQHITGPVTVKANTTAEWAAQARAATRARNLTATRSVRWSKP